MGWLFRTGVTRRGLIRELTQGASYTNADGQNAEFVCLAYEYQGTGKSGVLWSAWAVSTTKNGQHLDRTNRWITCDMLQYRLGSGWGYRRDAESDCLGFISCPLEYLNLVPAEIYGGSSVWRDKVRKHYSLSQQVAVL